MANDASTDQRLVVLHSDGDYALGTVDHYLVCVWRSEVTPHSTMHWGRVLNELRAARPGTRFGAVSYVEPQCRFPVSQMATQTFIDLLRRNAEVLRGTAVVYNREGFWGAGLRSQVTSVMTESKSEVPYFVALTLEPAVAWLVEALNDATQGRAAALVKSVGELRAAPTIVSGTSG